MMWFYNLKRKIRVIITVSAWCLTIVVCGIFGSMLPENAVSIPWWQAIIILVLLAVATVVTVFAVIARNREKKAMDDTIQHDKKNTTDISDVGKQIDSPQNNNVESKEKTIEKADMSKYSKIPDIINLVHNRNNDMQDNISFCNVGDDVDVEYDYDKFLYLCSANGFDIGYLPEKISNDLQGSERIVIDDITENDESVYAVKVAIYKQLGVNLPLHTKIVGVTFDNRQDYIKASKIDDAITIKHAPLEKYPEASIVINNRTGKTLGSIKSELAEQLFSTFGGGFVLIGNITDITGGTDDKNNVGCNIVINEVM